MKIKEKTVISKTELAKFLQNTAKNILDNNSVSIGGNKIDLPDEFEMKLKSKEKNGRNKFEIEIVWNTDKVINHHTKDSSMAKVITPKSPNYVPGNFKGIKKDMEKKLFEIERYLKNNQAPQKQEIQHFMDLVQAFMKSSKPGWLSSINELQTSATALNDAVLANNYSLALTNIADIRSLKDKYHKKFK